MATILNIEWRAGLYNTILNGNHPRTIPAKFGGFRGKDLNVKVYDIRWTTDERQTPSDG